MAAGTGVALAASSLALLTSAPAQAADPVEVNILGINDFHGRINSSGTQAGAAVLAGAVDQIRGEHPNTVFAAAGDLIGASTFESFIQQDKPTIDALNAAGLEVSAVGNHEFDQGYDDLVNRVMADYDAETNPYGGAEWAYLGANVKMKVSGDPALDATFVKTFGEGDSAVEVGFIGAVTEHLDELVSPGGIADIETTDIPTAVNTEADALKADGVDLIVMLVHEGAPSTDCATMDDDPTSDFGEIVTGVNANVDAIISGHTHLAYDCSFPVGAWSGRAVTERPVVSAGQYGVNLNQLTFEVDPDTGLPTSLDTSLIALAPEGAPAYPADETVTGIVDAANETADVLGAEPLGEIAGPFQRARLANGNENRGGESALGNLVAEVQRDATGADIAFMNPGGLRADMLGLNEEGYPATLTYKQAAEVQPFANTLVNMDLTGAQIKDVLEEQWQPTGASRPFLRLGSSDGFEVSYDPGAAPGEHVDGVWLNDAPIEDATTYSVTVNSFLATGGDNFGTFADGADPTDTGQIDLQAMVEYMGQFDEENPLDVDYAQHSVGAQAMGDEITLRSLAMTGPDDVRDEQVEVFEDETSLGLFDVDSTVGSLPFDESGSAVLPNPDVTQPHVLRVVGESTGTEALVEVALPSEVAATAEPVTYGTDWQAEVTVTPTAATGDVEILNGATSLGTAPITDGAATVDIDGSALVAGAHTLTVRYRGDDTYSSSESTLAVEVTGIATTTTIGAKPLVAEAGVDKVTIAAAVEAEGATPTGDVAFTVNGVEAPPVPVVDGMAVLTAGPLTTLGTYEVSATYLGDDTTDTSTSASSVTFKVVKAAPRLTVKTKPGKVVAGRTKVKVISVVKVGNQGASGRVEVKVGGKTYKARLNDDGRALVTLNAFGRPGKKTVKVVYPGNGITKPAVETVKIQVRANR
jgi:5'-nucleotidase